MGATVTTRKLATAIQTAAGTILYVLFEETYEKNCHPHTPNWSCFHLGTLDGAIKRLFRHASSCEGGMLQGRGGDITAEGYIAGWLKELANPVELDDRTITLKVADSFYSTVHTNQAQAVFAVLAQAGRQDAVDTLAAGGNVDLTLRDDGDLLSHLYGGSMMSAWRAIRGSAPVHGVRNSRLGYAPKAVVSNAGHAPRFMKVDRDVRLVQRGDGSWYVGGWEYAVVGHYIAAYWETEIREPGSYRKRIKAYRAAVSEAPPMPEGMTVAVDVFVPLESAYQREMVDKFPSKYPGQVSKTAKGYDIAVTDDARLLWEVTQLPEACATWLLPKESAQPEALQLSLLAA